MSRLSFPLRGAVSTAVSVWLLCGGASGLGAQTPVGAGQAPAGAPAPAAIPASAISDRAVAASALLRSASAEVLADEDLQAVRDEFASEQARVAALHEETAQQLKTAGPALALEETEKRWLRVEARLDEWLRTLTERADVVGSMMQKIRTEKKRWELTRAAGPAGDLPPELTKTVEQTLASISEVEHRLRSARDAVLSFQATIGEQKALADEALADLRRQIAERRSALLGLDSPPLWRALALAWREGDGLTAEVARAFHSSRTALGEYLAENGARFLGHFVLIALLAGGLIVLRRRARLCVEKDRSLQSMMNLLDRPLAAALILSLPFVSVIHPIAPAAWSGAFGLVFVVAGLRLVPQLVHPSRRTWAYPLASLLLVWTLVMVTPGGGPLDRLALLLLSLLGGLACLWIARAVARETSGGSGKWSHAVEIGARFAGGLFAVTAIANVVGAVGLASLVTGGTLYAIFAALLLSLAGLLLQGLVRIGLLARAAGRLGLVRSRAEAVRATLFRLIQALVVAVWVYTVLNAFLVIDPVVSFVRGVLEAELLVGTLAVSLADVLIFVLVVWLSFKLSQLIRFALKADVFPHMHLPRGAPEAVGTLTHYAVMVIGVMVAFSAAGFDMSRISIIFGALGVGVGFGLQNVVNNFVSGLILLFERPIKVGDAVQLDTTLGVVKEIGIRVSRLRTYDGAEVIVPNSALTSAEVVNWTYRDDQRRTEIPVGVAYGTDPARVIELLLEAARKHPEVSDRPEPQVLFREFGDSALEFSLRIWTATDSYLRITSELRVSLVQVLAEAGISIPFPQRDLHVRSIADGVSLGERVSIPPVPGTSPGRDDG
jgi:small-conductance mechanosensitive channel